jgi:hypothetical protein
LQADLSARVYVDCLENTIAFHLSHRLAVDILETLQKLVILQYTIAIRIE